LSDGYLSVQTRIAEIQRRFGAQAPAPVSSPPVTSSPGSSSSSTDFAALLEKATKVTETNKTIKTGTPVDLSSFANGKIPESLLTSIGNGEKLAAPAASSFLDMQTAAKKAGINITVNDSYRSFEDQVAMAKSKGLYGQGGLAATPGHSEHGKGISVDLQLDPAAQKWMQTNAKDYGYVANVKGEPWHWSYKP